MIKTVNVHIGEVKIGRTPDQLQAILGSCVGVAFLWKKNGIYGLGHSLLPSNPQPSFMISGRYVDQAIKSLIALMHIRPEHFQDIEVIVTGGSNMTLPDAKNEDDLVGVKNVKTAFRFLNELNMKISHNDNGGNLGRKIMINCTDGTFKIDKIKKIVE